MQLSAYWTRHLVKFSFLPLMLSFLLLLTGIFSVVPAYGDLQGANVVIGEAQINRPNSTVTEIHQYSDRAVIEYDRFSLAADEILNIYQPDSQSAILNRVVGDQLSEIYGSINANGEVFIVNQAGVLFSQGSRVNVGGLVVSSLDLPDEQFIAGNYRFQQGSSASGNTGDIIAQGQINTSDQGRIVFIAPQIVHEGQAHAPDGEISFIAGDQVVVPEYLYLQDGDSPIAIAVEAPIANALIQNYGRLDAGRVTLHANAENALYSTVIEHQGMVRAQYLSGEGGEVYLSGNADVLVDGSLGAQAEGAQAGGSIHIEANRVAVNAVLSVDGERGGGILINAQDTLVLDSESVMSADAYEQGDGGRIVVISEDTVLFRTGASISARAGDIGGDGGFIEVSGRDTLEFSGHADASAAQGQAGLVYIDPIDIRIEDIEGIGADNDFDAPIDNTARWNPQLANGEAVLAPASIQAVLATGSNISIDTAAGDGGSGNIEVNSPIDFNGAANGAQLSLTADGDIVFSNTGAILDSDPSSAEAPNIRLVAGDDFIMAADASINAGTGRIDIVVSGDASVSGLSTENIASDAITLNIAGALNDAGDTQRDITNSIGGLNIEAGSVNDIEVDIASLNISSAGVATLHQALNQALQIEGASVLGDFRVDGAGVLSLTDEFHTFGGDVTLANNGSDVLQLPNSGLAALGDVTLVAGQIQDSDNVIQVFANSLSLSQAQPTNDLVVQSAINQLSLNNGAATRVTIDEADNLAVLSLNSMGDVVLNVTGELILPVEGLTLPGSLQITAADIHDVLDRSVSINASRFSLASSLDGGDLTLNTDLDNFSFNSFGSNALNVNDSGDLIVDSGIMGGGGNVLIQAQGNLVLASSDIELSEAIDSQLRLEAGNDLVIGVNIRDTFEAVDNSTDIQLVAGQNVTINTGVIVHAGDGQIDIRADQGNVQLSGLISTNTADDALRVSAGGAIFGASSGAGDDAGFALDVDIANGGAQLAAESGIQGLNTRLASLGIVHGNSNTSEVIIVEQDDLTLRQLSLGSASLDLQVGILTIPASGLNTENTIRISASDITSNTVSDDRTINITASALELNISAPADAVNLISGGGILDAHITGNNLNVTAEQTLELADLNNDAAAIVMDNGDIHVDVVNGDLNINANVSAQDNSDDGVRSGLISLQARAGDITLASSNDVTVLSTNTFDPNLAGGLGEGIDGNVSQTSIWLNLGDNSALERRIRLGDDNGFSATITAQGGDVVINALGGTESTAASLVALSVNNGSTLNAFNSAGDALLGELFLGAEVSSSITPYFAGIGRRMSILPGDAGDIPFFSADSREDISQVSQQTIETESSAIANSITIEPQVNTVGTTFKSVFGDCDSAGENRVKRCKVDAALQSFLYKWTIGGELPPKVEVGQ